MLYPIFIIEIINLVFPFLKFINHINDMILSIDQYTNYPFKLLDFIIQEHPIIN